MTHQKSQDSSFIINRYRLFMLTVGLFAALTVGFYVFAYIQLRTWQVLVVPILIVSLVIIFAPLVVITLNRGRTDLSGILILIGLALAYGGNELAWIGLTVYHLVGGILLLILAGNFVLPRRYGLWLAAGLLYLIYILLVNWLPGLARADVSVFPIMVPFALGANLLLLLAILAQVLVEFQARSIRARLLGTFLLLVILPVGVIGGITSLLSATFNSRQVYNQLDTVVSLKEYQVTNWFESLQQSLDAFTSTPTNRALFLSLIDSPDSDPASAALAQENLNAIVASGVGFREVFLVDASGTIILSTEAPHIGADEQASPYLNLALAGAATSPVYNSNTFGENVIIVAIPLLDETNQPVAVIAGRVDQNRIVNIFAQRDGLGESGESYLVTSQYRLLTPSHFSGYSVGQEISSPAIDEVIRRGLGGENLIITGGFASYHDALVLGYYRWLPELQAAVIAEQGQSEALAPTYQLVVLIVVITLILVVIAFLVGLYATRRISQPLAALSQTAEKIAAGDLSLDAEEGELAEINALARSFNAMTRQLRGLVTGLEQRVLDRTQELERRSQQLQIAADVAREATAIRDLDELLNRAVYLVRERFGYYHAGLFLLDDRKEYAVLAAATGEAGKRLLERNHRLRVGESGMVGFVSRTGNARVAEDVTRDSTHYANPDLPDTRAEAALPLKAGIQVIGVLDVQSTREGAFNDEVLEVLQIVADQFAVAIESARLLRQTQSTLRELQAVSGAYTRDAWRTAQQRLGNVLGYRYRGLHIDQIQDSHLATSNLIEKHVIPLRLRDQTIGSVELQFDQPPNKDALQVFDELGARLALLLENARLVQEAQNLAAREKRINVITSQVRSSLNLDAILQNTVRELGVAFGASRTFVQLNPVYRMGEVGVADNGGPENDVETNVAADNSTGDLEASNSDEDNITTPDGIFQETSPENAGASETEPDHTDAPETNISDNGAEEKGGGS